MATPSPTPPQQSSINTNTLNGKSSSGTGTTTTGKIFETLNTLGRKKKLKELEQLQNIVEEGKQAIDGNEQHPVFDTSPESFVLAENEERSMIEPGMINNYDYQELLKILINWINDELSDHRIIVKDLTEDLYDGQILGKLVEKLGGQKLGVVEVTQNEDFQRAKLKMVLEMANRLLGLDSNRVRWTAQGIHNKNTVEIIHLLVALIRHFRAPIRLPPNVQISILIIQKLQGQLHKRVVTETLTEAYDELSKRAEPRDAFDMIFDHTPEKVYSIKQSVAHFINMHLSRLNIELSPPDDIDPNSFSDGLNIIFLIGMLEGYFVPLGNIYTTASVDPIAEAVGTKETAFKYHNYIESSPHHKLHNVNVALELLEDAGINLRHKVRAEEIVNADLKATLRVLFMIFSKYKNIRY